MKVEDKQLLLKDLCSRLPYDVIVEYGVKYEGRDLGEKKGKLTGRMLDSYFYNITVGLSDVYSIKPYLRPMSSMTEEEMVEFKWLNDQCDNMPTYEYVPVENYRIFDWLNRHHFDYRGLIPKGLAIEVTEENNPYKE